MSIQDKNTLNGKILSQVALTTNIFTPEPGSFLMKETGRLPERSQAAQLPPNWPRL